MADTALAIIADREKAAATRTPPDWCRGHGFERKFGIKKNECTPDAQSKATLTEAQRLIAAGRRLAEVARQLKNERMNLREFQRANPTIFRAGLIMRLRDIIEYAEAGDA